MTLQGFWSLLQLAKTALEGSIGLKLLRQVAYATTRRSLSMWDSAWRSGSQTLTCNLLRSCHLLQLIKSCADLVIGVSFSVVLQQPTRNYTQGCSRENHCVTEAHLALTVISCNHSGVSDCRDVAGTCKSSRGRERSLSTKELAYKAEQCGRFKRKLFFETRLTQSSVSTVGL